jgi:nucleotide-binding universal stress UspA family protein
MKIICGTDFSAHANDAALAAAALTGRVQGELTLVHVLDADLYRNPAPEFMKYLRDGRQKKLNALVDRAQRRAAKAEGQVVEGTPAAKLAELANTTKAKMLIVSSNGQIAASKWFVGSIADQAVQNSLVPTLVLRKPGGLQDWVYAKRNLRVLIGYDFSASAEAALHWAAALRRIAPCDITVTYVASAANERSRLGMAPAMSPLYYPAGIKKFLEMELEQKCAAVLGRDGATTCVKADWGRPDSHLIEVAADNQADLIVVGTSQRRGLARLGSISRAVLHYAHMNVACIPAPRADEEAPVGRSPFERVLVPVDFYESAKPAVATEKILTNHGG